MGVRILERAGRTNTAGNDGPRRAEPLRNRRILACSSQGGDRRR
jgi:hypothetical protein